MAKPNYKDLTLEEIEKKVKEIYNKMNPDMFVKDLGNGMFRLPGGAMCNKAGLKMFHDAVLEEGKKMIVELKDFNSIKPYKRIRPPKRFFNKDKKYGHK